MDDKEKLQKVLAALRFFRDLGSEPQPLTPEMRANLKGYNLAVDRARKLATKFLREVEEE